MDDNPHRQSRRSTIDEAFLRAVMETNDELAGSAYYHGAGSDSDRLPSEYPEGGSGGRRWST